MARTLVKVVIALVLVYAAVKFLSGGDTSAEESVDRID